MLIDGAYWRDGRAVPKPGHTSIIIEGSIDSIWSSWLPQSRGTHTHTVMHAYRRLSTCTGKHLQSSTRVILTSDISAHFSLDRRLIFLCAVQRHMLCFLHVLVVGSLQPGWVPACMAAAQYS